MTPNEWARLTPQQQWQHTNQYGPPPPHYAAAPAPAIPMPAPRNSLAKTALTVGAVGLIVFPIVLGPAAFILGGTARGMARERGGRREANIAVALGLLDIVIGTVVWAWLSTYL